MFTVTSVNRKQEINGILAIRCYVAVQIVMLFWSISQLENKDRKPVFVSMADVPGYARMHVKKALNFYRKEMPFKADF